MVQSSFSDTAPWLRLVKIVDHNGNVSYGDLCVEHDTDLRFLLAQGDLQAIRLDGDDPFDLTRTDKKIHVARLLGVLNETNVLAMKCIGLNYVKHSEYICAEVERMRLICSSHRVGT